MKEIIQVIPADFYESETYQMVIEQTDYSHQTVFYVWPSDEWQKQKDNDYCRSAYFIIRPKTTSNR